jgi:hypothetical protein
MTTFTNFATRGGGAAGREQLLKWAVAGDKFLPVCDAIPPPLPTGQDRMPRGGCLALRWAVLSSVAARALVAGSETATTVAHLVQRYRQRAARPSPPATHAAHTGCVLLEGEALVRSYEPLATGLVGCLAKRDAPSQRRQGLISRAPMCAAACAEEPPPSRRNKSPSLASQRG